MTKTDLRKDFMDLRLAMSDTEWKLKSQQLCQELLVWLKGQPFDKVALFRCFRREPDLTTFENSWDRKKLYYPKSLPDGQMEFYGHPGTFVKGRYGIEEPDGSTRPLLPDARTLILVPGLAYDAKGYRLGYGGGYYDRYFHFHPSSRMGICFSDFLVPELPAEAHDQRVTQVFTEKGIC